MKRLLTAILIFIFLLAFSSCTIEADEDSGSIDYKEAMLVLPSGELIQGSLDGYFFNLATKNIYVHVQIDGVWYCTHPLNLTLIGE